MNLFAFYPGVVYQSDTTCRCGESPRWQAKEESGSGQKNCSPSHYSSRQHYTQPDIKATNIKDSQLVHCPHPEKPAGFMRKAAGLSRTVCSYKKLCFKVSCNYYLYIFILIVHFQKKLVNLGTTLLRTLRTLQKARRSNSPSWQGSLNY